MSVSNAEVDLGAVPSIPFEDAMVATHAGVGLATLERRAGELYLAGRRVILWQAQGQQQRRMSGPEVRQELLGKDVLNANVLDTLIAHPALIPERWKNPRAHIYFWGTIYRDTAYAGLPSAAGGGGSDFVRYLAYEVGRKGRFCRFTDSWDFTAQAGDAGQRWGDHHWAAVLEG